MAHTIERIPYGFRFKNETGTRDAYGGTTDYVVLEAQLVRPVDHESDTLIVFMHPVLTGAYLPIIGALAKAGHHILVASSRYRGNDAALLMEKVVQDLGESIKFAKKRLGYSKIVLGGWSGGGSLSAFYQQQATNPTLTSSPSGDGPDLTKAELPPADAIMLVAAHGSRHGTLTQCLDASILDESDPTVRDASLDIYGTEVSPPYSQEFLEHYFAAQIARNRKITAWVKEKLAAIKASDRPQDEHCFVVHGTMGDPRWLDPTIDPNGREPGVSYLGPPQEVNEGPFGLARYTSLRSWLSQWSYDDARGDGIACSRDLTVPALVVGNLNDEICTPAHTHGLYEAVGSADKELYEIPDANHYYLGEGQDVPLAKAVEITDDWLKRHGFAGA